MNYRIKIMCTENIRTNCYLDAEGLTRISYHIVVYLIRWVLICSVFVDFEHLAVLMLFIFSSKIGIRNEGRRNIAGSY